PPDPHTVGDNGATLENRDPWLDSNRRYLSGDLKQNDEFSWCDDAGVLDLHHDNYFGHNWSNSTFVIRHDDSTLLVVDGVTIRGATGSAIQRFSDFLDPMRGLIVQDCIVEENSGTGFDLQGSFEIRRTLVRHNGNGGLRAGDGVDYLLVDSAFVRI